MTSKPGYWTSLHGLATLTLIGAALYFLLVEHGAHLLPYLPFLEEGRKEAAKRP